MSKIDYSVLEKYSKNDVWEFNKEINIFLSGTSTKIPSKDAIAYFYLTLNKLEEKRRGLSLEETHRVIRGLQGQVLTLVEASISDVNQQKAFKDIINNYFSQAQSIAQDYDWGRYDDRDGKTLDPAPEQPEV